MKEGTILHMVAAQCPEEEDTRFNTWYDEVHVPMLLKCEALKEVTRYKIVNEAEGLANYICAYRFDSWDDFQKYANGPELAAARAEVEQSWGDGFPGKWRAQYTVIKHWDNE